MSRLYALLDRATLRQKGWSLERFVARAEALGAALLQYRDKEGDDESVAEALRFLNARFGGRVIVNDRPELAPLCGGVHLGQEDLARYGADKAEAIKRVREIIGEGRWLGLSTHNKQEVLEANDLWLDYIGLGAYRATATKNDARVLGPKALEEIAALSRHPVAAIGGVRVDDNIAHVRWNVVGSGLYED
ncbi:MAG: thiamine phosphate synthase [Epsilonproteobacteria bacterium]|nr:thiamine phosphate synthase [Campylobacterota bacterium]